MRAVWDWLVTHRAISVFIVLVIYGFGLLVIGAYKGIYLQDITWVAKEVPVSDSYTISFYASAAQDFWFFFFVGAIVSLLFTISPKEECIENKINFLFRDVPHNGSLMEFLKEKFNENSCKLISAKKEISILEEDSGFLNLSIYSKFEILNMHHSTPLKDEFGILEVYTDDTVLKSPNHENWGRITRCELIRKNGKSNVVETGRILKGSEPYKRKYDIELAPGEVAEIIINYDLWVDKKESFKITPSFFTDIYDVYVSSQLSRPLLVDYKTRTDTQVGPVSQEQKTVHQEMVEIGSFSNLRVDLDSIHLKFN
ncbi:hypothetical protein [Alteromonas lipotrueae]|uniref:hypothetical protein n=1 Tax=Alteromonas lipotrueae TaxID=2803814 RepID=UPI001C47BAD9|nr:hypothetical protein [Alteromonas lipotrueae]